ncbi:ArsR/SmtB family transcription factor [Glycomyces paridis]|uniref:Helix-turn-helix transcriptional regulator n=1 Tax=Glycomyces paridis TaxID=2126555 RepID=A0A4S8PNW6_9ACTN|nr:helix-turn-helix domain-containing protein [Glycomyces paridis]THV30269.1 helix-turn-helix transcriptional regulator [Glycomyces paridis]
MSETSASHPENGLPRPPLPPVPPVAPVPPVPPGRPQGILPEDAHRVKITDPERMKALAHPARMAVFDFLGLRRVKGFDGATATEIAEVAGMTPSAMSYHLRTLAKAGFIEEAPSRGDARERVWRLALHSFSIAAGDDASESDKVIERTMGEAFRERDEENFTRFLDSRFDLDPKIRDASMVQHGTLRLTPEEAEEFGRRFMELEGEYAELTRKRIAEGSEGPSEAVVYHAMFRLFPRV